MKKVADIVVEVLQSAGVQRCYGVVGDTLNYVTGAIRRSSVQWVHVRHEATQVFGTVLYGVKAVLDGRGSEVVEMIDSNLRR